MHILNSLFRLVLTFIGLSFPIIGLNQGFHPPIHHFSPKDYGSEQPPENYSLCKDSRGFIYSGNVGAVLEYDGIEWSIIKTPVGVPVKKIHSYGDFKLAIGGLNMMGIIIPDEKGKLKFQSLMQLLPQSQKEIGEIITIHSIKNEVIFQTENALWIYDGKNLKNIQPESTFFRTVFADDRYFVRERGKGLMEYKNGKLNLFCKDSIAKDYGFFGLMDYDDEFFIGATFDVGFYLIDKKNGKTLPFASSFIDFYSPGIYGITKMEGGEILVNTMNYGVAILNEELEVLHFVGKSEGLRSAIVHEIVLDNHQNIWMVTPEGITWTDINAPLHFYNETAGVNGNIEEVLFVNDKVYAASSNGLFTLNFANEEESLWNKSDELKTSVWSVDGTQNMLFIAASSGLFKKVDEKITKIANGNFHLVKIIPQINKIIAASSDGVKLFSVSGVLEKEISFGKNFQRLLAIAIDTNNLERSRVWIGLTQGEGVIRIDLMSGGEIKYDVFDEMDGLVKGEVRPINFGNGIVFLTNNGMQQFIPEEEVSKSLSEDKKNDPAFNRGFFDVYLRNGKELKGIVTGMLELDSRIYACIDNTIGYLDDKNRLIKDDFLNLKCGRINQITGYNGDLWISSAEGIIRYNSKHKKNIKKKFNVFIKKIANKENDVISNGIFVEENQLVHLPKNAITFDYAENTIHLNFSTDYFSPDEKLFYSFWLEGSDAKWSEWTTEHKLKLSNLHEGDYTLHVKAKNAYGVESNELVLAFTVYPPWYRTWWAYVLYVIGAIIIVYLSIRIASYRLKQNNIRLEETVKERTIEIASKNSELEYQNKQIRHQKQEITDSINYAKRIQEAILPILKNIHSVFPESFVLFKPKDIVSGDFYWFAHTDNKSIIVCADCTGHGVPGAFMSMICTDRINHTVLEKKIITPSAMLTEVNIGIKRSLKQEDEENLKTKDGMDAAFCMYDHKTKKLRYAGANRPLWLLRNREIIEYKPTKMAVGGFTPEEQVFDEIEIDIAAGDTIYLSSDGYADQFGGPKGKKLMVKAFKELLLQNVHLPFKEQRNILDKQIEDWRNAYHLDGEPVEQIDDMCVIGIRFY